MLAAQSSYRWLEEDLAKRKEEEKIEEFLETNTDEILNELEQEEAVKESEDDEVEPEVEIEPIEEIVEYELPKTVEIELIPEPILMMNDIFPNAEDVHNAKPISHYDDAIHTELNESAREEPDEASVAIPDEDVEQLVQDENSVEERIEPVAEADIKTEGVTLNSTGGDYIEYDGKSMSKEALKTMRPDLFALTADTNQQVSTNFGTQFPKIAKKGDVFVRVDMLPNRVYKFDSRKWIEINKELSDSYLYDDAYVGHLIAKLDIGEYDVDLLTENEKYQIEEYIKKSN
jgi:hypothetical protein